MSNNSNSRNNNDNDAILNNKRIKYKLIMNNKPHTEETKKKISESNKGKKRSKEFCEKISQIRKQQHVKKSPETKQKISAKMKEIWKNRQVDNSKNIEE